jgi:hypothetical protein
MDSELGAYSMIFTDVKVTLFRTPWCEVQLSLFDLRGPR